MSFKERVLKAVSAIPKGRVATYAWIAAKAGSPRAARAVGSFMRGNFDPGIPCHRVVRSDLRLGGYNRGGELAKASRLRKEGVRIVADKVIR